MRQLFPICAARRWKSSRRNSLLLGTLLAACALSPIVAATASAEQVIDQTAEQGAGKPAEPALGHGLHRLPANIVAPGFSLPDMDEEKHTLQDYQGKVILLNFWATWCPPCRREMPSMERLYQSLKDEDFVVVAINQFEDPDYVFTYTGQLDVDPTFPILFDSDSTTAELYGVKGLPSTYLIDKRGRVRYRAVGGREFDHPEVVALIRELMDEPTSER